MDGLPPKERLAHDFVYAPCHEMHTFICGQLERQVSEAQSDIAKAEKWFSDNNPTPVLEYLLADASERPQFEVCAHPAMSEKTLK